MIKGNTEGIRKSTLEQLELAYELELPSDEFAPIALLEMLAAFTGQTGREVSAYVKRDGTVMEIAVGDQDTVTLSPVHLRRNQDRLAGVRCIHTHPGGNAVLSDVDIQSLKRLHLDAMAAVGVKDDGRASALSCALIEPDNEAGFVFHGPYGIYQIPQQELMQEIYDLDPRVTGEMDAGSQQERCVLVGLCESENDETMLELGRLAETAGAQVLAVFVQNRQPEPSTYIGKGKAHEIFLAVQGMNCDLVIINDELTGAQTKKLEEILGVRVIDRAVLILDIFAQRARSREGKLQVELAQLQYKLPRLIGEGLEMSRLLGGIGIRGPGESKLEMDRRRIRERISDIKKEIQSLDAQRAVRRVRRENHGVPVAALVGYTNAGKSTLLNHLTGSGVLAEDKLFATLDTTTRALRLPDGNECLLTDTVGFIDKLPHDLVNAFRSTLEEALFADLLVIISDASSPNAAAQHQVVEEVLASLGAGDRPTVLALNKSDAQMQYQPKDGIPISAKTGEGIDNLLAAIQKALDATKEHVELLIPYGKEAVLAYLHREGTVESQDYEEGGTRIQALVEPEVLSRINHMLQA